MLIIPTIQLLDGNCVTLTRGNISEPEVWHGDPVERALDLVEQGAERLHVTDLGGVTGGTRHTEIMQTIIRQAGVPVQVSGGIRSDETVGFWREAGAARIVFGTSAITDPDWVKRWAKAVPDYFIVSVDVYQGHVMNSGWGSPSMFTPIDFVHGFDGTPLAALIVTDIDRDIDLPEASIALTAKLAEETRIPIISSGLVKEVDDISTLRYVPNIAGVMLGRALFNRSVELKEALTIAKPEPGRTAEFI